MPQRRLGRNCLSWKRAQPTRSTRNLPASTGNRRTQCSSPKARFFSLRQGRLWRSRHAIESPQSTGEFAEAGGLMSYGYSFAEGYRELGRYAGRILNGEKAADLPII